MTLYEMLDRTTAVQDVWIFETNTYDQNMPLFKGRVEDARVDRDSLVWSYLMCEVEYYDCSYGILDIRLKDEYYNFHLEDHYLSSGKWGTTQDDTSTAFLCNTRTAIDTDNSHSMQLCSIQ